MVPEVLLNSSRDPNLVIDDATKVFGVERCSANKSTIDIRLSNETVYRIFANASTVQNSGIIGNCLAIHARKNLSAGGMNTLGNLWSGNLASSNSPNGLIYRSLEEKVMQKWIFVRYS